MKHARIIIALLVLLGAASLAEAQIVVSQTTASTTRIHAKSGREKGFIIRPEVGIGSNISDGWWAFNLYATFAYQFNPYFAIGVGTGLNSFPFQEYDRKTAILGLPLFVNSRVYFSDRQWSPFFDVKMGYNEPLKKSWKRVELYNGISDYTYYLHGFMLFGTLGMQHKNLDLGCTIGISRRRGDVGHNNYGYEYNEYNLDRTILLLGVYIAYNFQFKKK